MLLAAALPAAGAGLLGCGPGDQAVPLSRAPLCFPAQGDLPQVRVYGRLAELLPTYNATPAIDLFLYGPSDFGRTTLRNPQGLVLAGARLLVCDQGHQDIVAIDLNTGRSLPWCDPDHPPRCPVDITAGPDGRVYAADTTLRAVLVYEATGSFVEELRPVVASDNDFRPSAVRVYEGILYVGNLNGRRIERYHLAERRWIKPLTPPAQQGTLAAPTGLAFTSDGTLLIADAVRARIFRVTADERWLEPISRPGRSPGELVRPKQIGYTPGGIILVVDAGRQSVLVFESDGRFITEVHEQPSRWMGWTLPMGLLVVRAEDLPTVEPRLDHGDASRPDCYVIVSDSLGPDSLTLLGIVERKSKGADHGG